MEKRSFCWHLFREVLEGLLGPTEHKYLCVKRKKNKKKKMAHTHTLRTIIIIIITRGPARG